jgi:hypothetical protein
MNTKNLPPMLARLINSIQIVDGKACYDYASVYDVRDALAASKAQAEAMVAAERERCANVCEQSWEIDGSRTAAEFAARIRA